MLADLMQQAGSAGLQVHMGKTKTLCNIEVRRGVSAAKKVQIGTQEVEVLPFHEATMYLGRNLTLGPNFHDAEIEHRISKGWAKFYENKTELCSKHYATHDRLRLFEATITPTVFYGSTSWTLTAERERKLKVTQRKMVREVWGCSRRRRGRDGSGGNDANEGAQNGSLSSSSSSSSCGSSLSAGSTGGNLKVCQKETYIEWLQRTSHLIAGAIETGKVKDWVDEQKRRKWRWAGHVARRKDGRWTTSLLYWIPHMGKRAQGRPLTRWDDALSKFTRQTGQKWKNAAQDRDWWEGMTEEFVKHS
jgi:hypothetical protein